MPFLSPIHESESESEVAQSRPTLSDPMDYNLPGSSVHGIAQTRVLEWGAIAFSLPAYWSITKSSKDTNLFLSANLSIFHTLFLFN